MDQLIRAYHAAFIADRTLAYAFAVICVLVALLLRVGVGLLASGLSPFATLFPAVLIAAVLGGVGPGALALFLSIAAAWFLFLDTTALHGGTAASLLDLLLFGLCGAAMLLVGATLQAAVARSDQALKEAEEGERRLRTALEAGQLGSISYDLKHDRGNWSPAFSAMLGLPASQTGMSFAEWLKLVHPDDRRLAEASLAEALATETGTYKTRYRILRPDGSARWLEFFATVTRDDRGVLVGLDGVALDITERLKEDERRQEIVHEMHHRIQNVLTMVQALARRTVRQATSLDDFATSFAARLDALAATHDLLIKKHGQGVTFAELVRAETAPFEAVRNSRIKLDGPDLMLPPPMITPLGLVMHELTTNAAKYGALAHEDGQVSVTWSTSTDDSVPLLSVAWHEQGGQPATAPSELGFGSRLITRMIRNDLGGSIEFQWLSEGLHCTFTVPLVS